MIQRLHIDDFAIVSDLTVDFSSGLNILSGETGAGKSIIIGALNLLLGERAQIEMIRSGEEMAVVEGSFQEIEQIKQSLKVLGIESVGGGLDIRREIKRSSASRCFINGQMVTLADLKTIGQKLVDLVGQHHQQLLLDQSNHIHFLDNFAENQNLLDDYHEKYREYQTSKTHLSELRNRVTREKERMELYHFQLHEIESAKLSVEEEDDLLKEKQLLENAENLKSSYYTISEQLYHGEGSTTEIVTEALNRLAPLQKFDNSITEIITALKGSLYSLQEAGRFLQGRSDQIEHDPKRLLEIEERLDTYYNLKKKYGGSLAELFKHKEKIDGELGNFADWSSQLEELGAKVEDGLKTISALAEKLSERRHKSARRLAKQVANSLESLLMGKVEFEVRVLYDESSSGEYDKDGQTINLGPDGMDIVEFLFSPNPGEELKALAKIASGGELSRVLLALKAIVSGKNKNTCLIFDEIDSGIGGKTASAVGRSLQNLAQDHQVLVITHLQQIASCGENHFLVFKEKSAGRMVTRIKKLSHKERKEEIGRMISGDSVTGLSIKQAEELLKNDSK
jgi:DNA repair protein RecN (Recombination protein N)